MAIKFLNSVNADSGVLYVDAANDRVGIGTTSPDSGLDVRTTSRFWHGSTSNYTSFAYGNEINTFNSSGGNAVMYLQYRSGHLNVGAGTLFVQSGNSNVGIGTTSPSQKLHVAGNAIIENSSGAELNLKNTSSGSQWQVVSGYNGGFEIGDVTNSLTDASAVFFITSSSGRVGIGTTAPAYKLDVNGTARVSDLYVSGNIIHDGDTNNRIVFGTDTQTFRTAGTDRLHITSAGNVGIGTTSPNQKLEVAGRVRATTDPTFEAYNTSANRGGFQWVDSSVMTKIFSGGSSGAGAGIIFETNTAEKMRITSAGNVGIGTTSPTHLLTLETASSPGIKIKDTTQGNTLLLFSQDSDSHVGTYSSHPLVFDTNSTERMRITSDGNIGIGVVPKTGGSTWQHIQFGGTGNIIARKSDSTVDAMFANNYYINSSNVDSHIITGAATRMFLNDGEIRFDTAPSAAADAAATFTNRMFIANGGNVGIGTTSPTEKLHVNGNVKVAGSVGVTNIVTNRVVKFNGSVLDDSLLYDNGTTVAIGTTSPNSWAQLETTGTVAVGGILYIKSSQKIQGLTGFPGSAGNLSINPDGGNVGIGTTSPVRPLHIHRSATSTDVRISLTDGTTGAGTDSGFDIIKGTNQNAYLWNYSNATMRFGTNALERMRITNTGNVGIGTTSPNPHNWGQRSLTVQAEGTNAYSALEAYGTGTGAGAVLFGAGSIMHSSVQSTNGSHLVFTTNASNSGISQTERMRILSNGNVGIGTTSPSQKLAVIGNVIAGAGAADNYFEAVHSDGSSTRMHGYGLFMGRTYSYIRPTADNTHELYIGTSGNQWSTVSIDSSTTVFDTNGVERMRITSAGNVGIGAVSPAYKLDVNGNVGITGDLEFTKVDGIQIKAKESMIFTIDSDDNDTGRVFQFKDGGGDTLMRISDDGNVGIGTAVPSKKLHITLSNSSHADEGIILDSNSGYGQGLITHDYGQGNGITAFKIANGYTGSQITLSQDSYSSTGSPGSVRIYTSPSGGANTPIERMRITADGNVGIGTTSPAYKLDVNGEGRITGMTFTASGAARRISTHSAAGVLQLNGGTSASDGAFINIAGDSYSTGDYVDIYAGKTYFSGNVGIGSSTPNNFGFLERVLHISAGSASSTTLQQAGLVIQGSSDADDAVDFGYLAFTNYQSTLANDRVAEIRALRGGTVDKGELSFFTADGSTVAERMRLGSSGNFGIGTASPTEKLHVSGNIKSNHVYAETYRSSRTDGDIYIQAASSSDFVSIGTEGGNNNLLTVLGSGNVGVGTASPSEKLHVSGNVRIEGDLTVNGSYTQIDTNTLTTEQWNVTNDGTGPAVTINQKGAQDIMDVQDDGTSVFYIEDGGNVGIGTTNPTRTLHVAGTGRFTDNLYSTSTDVDGIKTRFLSGAANNSTNNGTLYLQYGKSNPVSIGETGSSDLYVAGDVGIGTTTPIGKIDIRGNYGRWRINGYGGMYFRNDSDTGYTRYIHPRSDGSLSFGRIADANLSGSDPDKYAASSYDQFYLNSSGTAFFNGGINFAGVNGANFVVDTDGQRIVWEHQRNGTRKMTFYHETDADTFNFNFESGNKLQINGNRIVTVNELGTAAASAATDFVAVSGDTMSGKLTLNGDLDLVKSSGNNALTINSSGGGNPVIYMTSPTRGWGQFVNGTDLWFKDETGNIVTMVLEAGGNVGIGTTSPSQKLHVVGNVRIDDGYTLSWGADTTKIAGNSSANTLSFKTASTDRLYINSSGNVGINTTSPSYQLDVNGAANSNTEFRAPSGKFDQIKNRATGNTVIDFDASNNVGIGTTSPSEKLEVNGNVKADSFIADKEAGIYSFSDTVDASSSEDIFSISNQHGAQAFRVTFVCSTSAYSVAKTFEVVHSYGNAPVFFKVVDTGAYGTHDFDVSFTNDATDDSKVVCSITNNSTTVNANIVSTVFLGGSPTTITVTAL